MLVSIFAFHAMAAALVATAVTLEERQESADAFQAEMLAAHNFFRYEQGVDDLTWGDYLRESAQSWADTCNFYHPDQEYGENLAYQTRYQYWGQFVNMWGEERTLYNYSNPNFSSSTGHFTQLVWRDTTTVGCGWTKCNGGEGKAIGYYVVCRYDPPGNWIGEFAQSVPNQRIGDPSDYYKPDDEECD